MSPGSPYQRDVTLPSQGLLYEGKLPEGRITVKALTVKDERVLMGQGDSEVILNKVLTKLTELPDTLGPQDLTLDDRLFLNIQLRNISYGSLYEYEYQCADCREMVSASLDLNDLPVLEPTEAWEEGDAPEPFAVTLADGTIVEWKFLRGSDEMAIGRLARQNVKRGIGRDGDPEYVFRLAKHVVGINGRRTTDEEKALTFKEIRDFVEGLYAQDSQALRNAIEDNRAGLDLQMEETCPLCGSLNEFGLPFTAKSFFRSHQRRGGVSD